MPFVCINFLTFSLVRFLLVLRLGKDEVTRYDKTLCGERISVRPYGSFGSVEISQCGCFVCVDSDLGTLLPSYGCDRDAVNCIANELRERISKQGETARSTAVHDQANNILGKAEVLLRHFVSSCTETSTSTMTMDDR
jgi:hypothetical protein